MPRIKPSNRVELKYCEGCGILVTRPVGSGETFCSVCEVKHSESRFLTHPKRISRRPARLPNGLDLQTATDPDADPILRACA